MEDTTNLALIGVMFCVLLMLLGIFHLLMRYVYRYHIDEDGVVVRVLGFIPLMRMRCEDILEVREISWSERVVLSLRHEFGTAAMGNRLWGRVILIRQQPPARARVVFVTPDDPDVFVEEVRHRMAESQGHRP